MYHVAVDVVSALLQNVLPVHKVYNCSGMFTKLTNSIKLDKTLLLFLALRTAQIALLSLIALASNVATTVLNVMILLLALNAIMDSSLAKIHQVAKFFVLTDAVLNNTGTALAVEIVTKTVIPALMVTPVIHVNQDTFGTQLTYLAHK